MIAKLVRKKTTDGHIELKDEIPLGKIYNVSDSVYLRCLRIGPLTLEELVSGGWRDSKSVIWFYCAEDLDIPDTWLPLELLEIVNE